MPILRANVTPTQLGRKSAGFTGPLSGVGMRLGPCGLMSDVSIGTNGQSYQTRFEVAVPDFDAVQLVYATGSSNGTGTTATGASVAPVVQANIRSISDFGATPASYTAAAVSATFAGSTSGTIPLAPTTATIDAPSTTRRRGILVSDRMKVPSQPRADGGTKGIVEVTSYVTVSGTTGGTANFMGGTGSPYSNLNALWNADTDRRWINRGIGANALSTSYATWGGFALSNVCPLIGVIYWSRNKVVNVAMFADSVGEGQYQVGKSFGAIGAYAAAAQLGVFIEYSNLAWSGANYYEIQSLLSDFLGAKDQSGNGLPLDSALAPIGTINGYDSSGWATELVYMRQMNSAMLGLLRPRRVPLLNYTFPPVTTAGKALGATADTGRVTLNNESRSRVPYGTWLADVDAVLAGTADGSGQVQLAPAFAGDTVHPNAAGNTAAAVPIQNMLVAALPTNFGGGLF